MSKPIIEVNGISKLYRLGLIGATTFRESVDRWLLRLQGKEELCRTIGAKHLMISPDDPQAGPESNTLWALKDISFSVQKGQVIGIIGKNGSGKSTLLKILSRITEPTEGEAIIRGRTASLLEVGTGFHPELTGRENIYLNGAILGMRKKEIDRKFDEIVAFAEVEKFIDTPVKRYSSGMYVRLAFAVAAHLEPEILIVDEVLAVGDSGFQKKCLGKIGEVAKEGRTVLFVSHNTETILNLCGRAFLLQNGRKIMDAETLPVMEKYANTLQALSNISISQRQDRQGSGEIRFTSVLLQNEKGENVGTFTSGQNVKIVLNYENNTQQDLRKVVVSIGIDNYMGLRLALLSSDITNDNLTVVDRNKRCFELSIRRLPLTKGRYSFTIFCTIDNVVADWITNAASFSVEAGDYYHTGKVLPSFRQGFLLMDYHYA